MAKIIVITNQKGGCGKTTLTMNLAGAFVKSGRVLVVNGDEQGSAVRWSKNNDSEDGFPASIVDLSSFKEQAHRELKKYVKDYDYIFVDCPPAVESSFTNSVLMVADLAIIPIIPSPTDMWAATGIEKLISNIQIVNEDLEARIVVNLCKHRNNVVKFAIKNIESFKFPKFDTEIYVRTAYEQAAAFGTTVENLDDAKAKKEIRDLKKEILKVLK